MTISELKKNKLIEFVELLKESLTKEEFLEAFKKVMEIVVRIKEENTQKLNEIISTFDSLKSKLDSSISTALSKNERIVATELESLLRRFSIEQKKIDDKLATIENGKDADETKIVKDVLAQLPKLQEIVNETLKQIPQQEEKIFGIEDIKNLKDELEELRKLRTGRFGGGFSKIAMDIHIISNETVSGSGTSWTLAHIPNPSNSLKLYGNGQRLTLTTDYTISGLAITTINSFSAGAVLADYNI